MHRVIEFNQKTLPKPYIDMNTKKWKKVCKNEEIKCKNIIKQHKNG